jgi:hypothetical protein
MSTRLCRLAALEVPKGFRIEVVSNRTDGARFPAAAPNGLALGYLFHVEYAGRGQRWSFALPIASKSKRQQSHDAECGGQRRLALSVTRE